MNEIKKAFTSYNTILRLIEGKDLMTPARLKHLKQELGKAMNYIHYCELLCDHSYVWDNFNDDECMKITCEKCGHKDA